MRKRFRHVSASSVARARTRLGRVVLCAMAAMLWQSLAGLPAASRALPVVAAAPVLPLLQVVGPGGGESTITSLIASARRRVLVEAFALDDAPVLAALQGAQRRGVDVRVMLDPLGMHSADSLTMLRNSGIRTRAPNPTFAVTHLDVVVVDTGAAAILTTGLTFGQLGAYGSGYLVLDRDRADVLQSASIFYDDWLRRPVSRFGHNLVLFPDASDASITALISAASARVELYTSALSDVATLSSLHDARSRGVVVSLLTTRAANIPALRLAAPTGHVRFRDEGPGTVLVVDRRTIFLGSMDLSGTAPSGSRELGVIVRGPAVARFVSSAFFASYRRGVVLAPPPPPRHPRVHRTVTVGRLTVTTDVSPQVRSGGTGVIVVTTAHGARVAISITYPAGSKPGHGTTGATGHADGSGRFVYRWVLSGHIRPGVARARIIVHGLGAAATNVTGFVVAP